MRDDKREQYIKERELELFYTLTSKKRLHLSGAVSGILMPWILFLIVIAALLISNFYDYLMWKEWVFDPVGLLKEAGPLLLGSTILLTIIGYLAGVGFPEERIRLFKTDLYFSRPFSYFVVSFFVLMTPFGLVIWILDRNFSLLALPSLFVISLLLSLVASPYWKAIFNKVIYRLSDFDAVKEVEKEQMEARSKQNVTRKEEQETYKRFLDEMRKQR